MATRVVEGKKPYTGGKAISIDENKVISLNLRDENNLIIYDEGDDEIYVDLQLPDGIEPTDAFPVGVTTGRAVVADGWDKAGTIISAKTTSGDEIKILYADDGTLWIDNGTGTFKQIYFKADVDAIAQAIWNYIHANCNTKSFGYINVSSGQDIYDRISSGNNYALVNWEQNGSGTNTIYMFEPTNTTTGEISSLPSHLVQEAVGGMFYETYVTLKFSVTDGVASNITRLISGIHNDGRLVLVDEPSNPIDGSMWYDTTNNVLKVYDGIQWNTTGGEIVYATQAEYNALLPGALTDNKHYFIYSTSGGGGWQPGANTIAYYPLEQDADDYSGNNNNLSSTGTVAYTTAGGVDSISTANGYVSGSVTNIPTGASDRTISVWVYMDTSVANQYYNIWYYGVESTHQNQSFQYLTSSSNISSPYLGNYYDDLLDNSVNCSIGVWYNYIYTYDGTTQKLYMNGVLAMSQNITLETANSNFGIGGGRNQNLSGNISNVIIEDVAWTAQEVSDYYNQTKANYGIS